MRVYKIFILSVFLLASGLSFGQGEVIKLDNPSFEDIPHRGGDYLGGIKGWYDCGLINFPAETPPDIHPKDFWSNTKKAKHGNTYLGIVVRDNDSWESVSQRLSSPIKGGTCYTFSIYLSQAKRYISASRLIPGEKFNYKSPTVLRIWGGNGICDTRELLAESAPVSHTEWKEYRFKLSPKNDYSFITLEAFYKVPVLFPYNGHILVDGASDIVAINCDDDAMVQVTEKPKKLPPHKKRKKRKKIVKTPSEKVDKEQSDIATSHHVPKRKKILNLDRHNLKKNQIVEIKNLYFAADTSALNEDSYEVLREIYQFLNANKDIHIEVRGHTNGIPSPEYCDKLSNERARVVAEYLVKLGIDGSRITYKGLGKRKPIASNRTKEGRKKNQRVEFKITKIDNTE